MTTAAAAAIWALLHVGFRAAPPTPPSASRAKAAPAGGGSPSDFLASCTPRLLYASGGAFDAPPAPAPGPYGALLCNAPFVLLALGCGLVVSVLLGLGRIVALHYRSSTLYQIH